MDDLNQYIREHPQESNCDIAKRFNVSSDIVRARRNRMTKKSAVSVEEAIKQDIDKTVNKAERNILDQKYKGLINKVLELERERDAALEISGNVSPIRIEPTVNNDKFEAVSVSVASDWHVDELVDPKKVNGRNKFNPQIAEERAKAFFTNTLKLIKKEQNEVKINYHVLALLGDFISGNIHEELLENTSMRPIEATLFAQNLIVGGIEYLLKNSDLKLVIPCSCGNHGRITKKLHISTEAGNSLEYFMYHNIKNFFRDNPRVEVIVSEGYHNVVDIMGFKERFHHGHAIKYAGGIGGLDVPLKRGIAQWNDKEEYADDDVLGHFHQYTPGKRYTVNGSLIGYNAYAVINKFPYEVPQQAFHLIVKGNNKVTKTGQFNIWLE